MTSNGSTRYLDLSHSSTGVIKALTPSAKSLQWYCRADVPSVIKAAVRQLKEKSVRTKQGVFAALQELVIVASDSIGAHTAQMMPGIQAALNVRPHLSTPPVLRC